MRKVSDRLMIPSKYPFVKALAHGLRGRCRVGPEDGVILAVSGGADSVALLRAAAMLQAQRGWRLRLSIAHVQHHLRDADGDGEGDADFVADLAGDLGIPFHREDLDPATLREGNLEAAARDHRYQRLEKVAIRLGASHVAVAHHADDALETLLMRLLRGTSVRGMRGMPWRRPIRKASAVALVRPMLTLGRAEVQDFLAAIGQDWREDATNADRSRVRSRLREAVLPVLHELAPGVDRRAVRLADHCRQVSAGLDHLTTAALSDVRYLDGGAVFLREEARRMPSIVLGSLLRHLLLEAGAKADRLGHRVLRPIVRAVRDHAGHTRSFQLSAAVQVRVDQKIVQVQRTIPPTSA